MRSISLFYRLMLMILALGLLVAGATGCQSVAPTPTWSPPTAAPTAAPPVAQATSAPAPLPTSAPTTAPAAASVPSIALTVRGTDAIYLAGRDDLTIPEMDADVEALAYPLLRCGGDNLETWPPLLAVVGGARLTLSASGGVDFYGANEPTPPDGEEDVEGSVDALGGISGYMGPNGALVGVYLSDANPAEAEPPETLDFSAEGIGIAFAELKPALGQVFFVGDGLTGRGSGATQRFIAPPGATRLYLGIADAAMFWGPPGCYEDNLGAFLVLVTGAASGGQAVAPGGAMPTTAAAPAGGAAPTAGAATPATGGGSATSGDDLLGLTAVAPDELDSYRSRIEIKYTEQNAAESVTVLEQEWVRADNARRVALLNGDALTFETIAIGEQTWLRMPPMGWQLVPGPSQDMTSGMGGAMSVQEMLDKDAENVAQGMQSGIVYEGQETVNGVRCRRYAVTLELDEMEAALGETGGTMVMEDYVSTGKVWVADEAGLPPVTVRTYMVSRYTLNGQPASVSMVMEVTDINQPITIEPPM